MTNNWPPPAPRRRYMDIHDGYLPPVREGKYDTAVRLLVKTTKWFWTLVIVLALILTILL